MKTKAIISCWLLIVLGCSVAYSEPFAAFPPEGDVIVGELLWALVDLAPKGDHRGAAVAVASTYNQLCSGK